MYTILHIEPGMLYKKVVQEICLELGAKYTGASGAREAFEILKNEKVNLILTAMELEGGSSYDFIRSINESEHRTVPVVVFTGNDSLEDRTKMYELGITDYILKTSGADTIKQNLATFRREDTLTLKMRDLSYAVVDDSKIDRKVVERIFSFHDIYNVDYYESGRGLAESGKEYDVYLIDFVLQDTSGDKIIMKLRESGSNSVIIAISGIDNTKTISHVLSIGASDYIVKPFNYDLFIARLKTNIRNYLLFKEVAVKTRALEKMAITDTLTGLFNRGHIYDRLNQEVEKAERYGSKFSLLMLDIDNFKKVNDQHGHQFGDEVLRVVSDVIRLSTRSVDICGRYGGEEFMVIFPEVPLSGTIPVAERIRKGIEAMRFAIDNVKITVSGGAADYSGSIENLVKKADTLMYRAKESGRNVIQY
ncbi:MAG TPA: diguanylate cyclase [Spirochaetota bacterium]|nr:diguanylate cyclase [Spirochaetota bacterium]